MTLVKSERDMPVPHDRPTFDQIMYALRTNGEAGDILCTHAAEEIERLTLTDEEREAIDAAATAVMLEDNNISTVLWDLLKRTKRRS